MNNCVGYRLAYYKMRHLVHVSTGQSRAKSRAHVQLRQNVLVSIFKLINDASPELAVVDDRTPCRPPKNRALDGRRYLAIACKKREGYGRHNLAIALAKDTPSYELLAAHAANIARVAAAGADTFVAGSAVYGADDPNAEIDRLRALAQTAPEGAR